MELDDLKRAWQSERGIENTRFDEIAETFHKGSLRLQSVIRQRDMVETTISFVFFVALLIGLYLATNWTMRASLGLGCLGFVIISVCLWWGRRSIEPPGVDFRASVDAEIEFLRRQIFLLKNVAWWYELPLGIGMVLFPMGANNWKFDAISQIAFIIYQLTILSVLVWVWWVNQKAVWNHLIPLLDYHVRLRIALDTGGSALDSVPEPPMGFVEKRPPEPISRTARRWWIVAAIVTSGSVAASGLWLGQQFDRRTGIFIAVCAPIVAVLVLFVSGLWKRPIKGE